MATIVLLILLPTLPLASGSISKGKEAWGHKDSCSKCGSLGMTTVSRTRACTLVQGHRRKPAAGPSPPRGHLVRSSSDSQDPFPTNKLSSLL